MVVAAAGVVEVGVVVVLAVVEAKGGEDCPYLEPHFRLSRELSFQLSFTAFPCHLFLGGLEDFVSSCSCHQKWRRR